MLRHPLAGHALGFVDLSGAYHDVCNFPFFLHVLVTLRGSGDEGSKLLGEAGNTDEH